MSKLTSSDIVKTVAARIGWTDEHSRELYNIFLKVLYDVLKKEGKLKFPNFGVLNVKHKKVRMARNPRTGEPASVSARFVVKFHPATEFKFQVNAAYMMRSLYHLR